MPTGYTAKLMEEGQTFQEFILTCARQFGALVMMRDNPLDAPIPEKFEPSNWTLKELDKDNELLNRLKKMSNEEKITFGEEEKKKRVMQYSKHMEREKGENKRLEEMENQVMAWRPPTKDHQGLKDFMLDQIRISKNDIKYIQKELKGYENKMPVEYYVSALSDVVRSINYHHEENKKEIERTNKRNEWLRQLRLSI